MRSDTRSSLEQARILMSTTVTGATSQMWTFAKDTVDHPGASIARSRFHE